MTQDPPVKTTLEFPVDQPGQYGDLTVVSLASATGGGGYWAEMEFGRRYQLSDEDYGYWSDWVTDVIRIERFSNLAVHDNGNFKFIVRRVFLGPVDSMHAEETKVE